MLTCEPAILLGGDMKVNLRSNFWKLPQDLQHKFVSGLERAAPEEGSVVKSYMDVLRRGDVAVCKIKGDGACCFRSMVKIDGGDPDDNGLLLALKMELLTAVSKRKLSEGEKDCLVWYGYSSTIEGLKAYGEAMMQNCFWGGALELSQFCKLRHIKIIVWRSTATGFKYLVKVCIWSLFIFEHA